MEYKMEVILNPHIHDNPEAPYFWCIYSRGPHDWCNAAHGWAKSPREASDAALNRYSELINQD